MEFHHKLRELRKQKGLTQEELADSLYVSRTAISKWESGRGYPNIESLKAIAAFFSVTVDELLSTDEVLSIAADDRRKTEKRYRDLVFGLLDICMSLLLFLPLFASKAEGGVEAASLLALGGVESYMKIAYFAVVIGTSLTGIVTLALQNCGARLWVRGKTTVSLAWGVISALLLMVGLQPYAAVFSFALLTVKVAVLLKRA